MQLNTYTARGLVSIRPCGDFLTTKDLALTEEDQYIPIEDISYKQNEHTDLGIYVRYRKGCSWAYIYKQMGMDLYVLLCILMTIKQKDAEGNTYFPPITKEILMDTIE